MDKLRVFPNERVNLGDFQAGAGGDLVFLDLLRIIQSLILPSGRATGAAITSARIFGGFGFDPAPTLGVSTQAPLILGTGIFPYFDGDTLLFGVVIGDEGPASRIVDVSLLAPGTYALYVKMEHTQGATKQNRVFWNPSGAPAAEYLDSVSPRDEATWSTDLRDATAAPPGNGEWVKIWEIDVLGGAFSAIRDYRHFFFEGSANAADGPFDPEWGDGLNDRNLSRDEPDVGIFDFHRWVQFVNRQLQDIIGMGVKTDLAQTSLQGFLPTPVSGNKTPIWQRHFYGVNVDQQEVFRYTTRGRLARGRVFKDDFDYHPTYWGSVAGAYPPYYAGTLVGPSTISVSAGTGSCVRMGVGIAPGNSARITSHPHFVFRSAGPINESRIGFYAKLHFVGVPDSLVKVGFTDVGAWRIWWEYDDSVGFWGLRVDDGAGGTFNWASIAAAALVDTHVAFIVDPFAGGGVGSVRGSIQVGLNTDDTPELALPGAGATFLGHHELAYHVETIAGGLVVVDLDFWEVWDERLHAGDPS